MEGLQRSTSTFRRSGSSGLVWEERFSTELAQKAKNSKAGGGDHVEFRELRPSRSVGSTGMIQRGVDSPGMILQRSGSKGKGGGGGGGSTAVAFRTANVVPPVIDPPSPKIYTCGFFGASKPVTGKHRQQQIKKAKR